MKMDFFHDNPKQDTMEFSQSLKHSLSTEWNSFFDASFDGADTVVKLFFAPMQSHILLLNDSEEELVQEEKTAVQEVSVKEYWNIDRMDLNSYTLDICEYQIDDGDWQEPIAVILLQNKLLELQRPCKIAMRFNFNVATDVSKLNEFYVVIEDAKLYEE